MALPFLPGSSVDSNLLTRLTGHHHRSQKFFYNNDTRTNVYNDDTTQQQHHNIMTSPPFKLVPGSNKCACPHSNLPSWITHDKKILCFDAYFYEDVTERRDETYRIHRCKVMFFLEDGTMQICEPREDNSGMVQGVILKRHKIPKPPPHDGHCYTVDDLNLGWSINVYNTTYFICDCDPFTRDFMRRSGLKVNEPVEIPLDSFAVGKMNKTLQSMKLGGNLEISGENRNKLKQHLEHDGHVLRFYCYWDDRENAYGDERKMILNYYLADDTVEVIEDYDQNCGKDAVPTFLRRCKLPKNHENSMSEPGIMSDNKVILNVFENKSRNNRYMVDRTQPSNFEWKYYKDCDLKIGAYVNVWGRRFLICDCDEFTKQYYKTKYGVENFEPINIRQTTSTSNCQSSKPIPPYNGFGSHEDSLSSALSLIPKPPKSDFKNFMLYDRQGLNGNVLRFVAKIVDKDGRKAEGLDGERKFIVSFYIADDSIMIFEKSLKNSGLPAGKFLEKSKVIKPGQERFLNKLPEYYRLNDMKVGQTIEVNGVKFLLCDADDYTYKYMMKHPREFPEANVELIMKKLKASSSTSTSLEDMGRREWKPECNVDDFKILLTSLSNNQISEHEFKTLIGFYENNTTDDSNLKESTQDMQTHLKKVSFDDYEGIRQQCHHFDTDRSKRLPVERVRMIFKAMRVQVPNDVIVRFLNSLRTDDNSISYEEMIACMNWHLNNPAIHNNNNNSNNKFQQSYYNNIDFNDDVLNDAVVVDGSRDNDPYHRKLNNKKTVNALAFKEDLMKLNE